mmetsp:Transcript_12147/g.14819  ORF Transcript_12147/g.14819 Transcript_12147/m.14819 type:complete len:552 (+) Transcript_12147:327-1982(+)
MSSFRLATEKKFKSRVACSDDRHHHDYLELFFREYLFPNSGSTLRKSEFRRFLLTNGKFQMIQDDVVDSIFDECDVDGDCQISLEELVQYCCNKKPKTKIQRTKFAVTSLVTSWFFWAILFYIIAGVLSVVANFLANKDPKNRFNPRTLSTWLFLVGSLGFNSLFLQQKKEAFELEENGRRILLKWVRSSSLFHVDSNRSVTGSITNRSESIEGIRRSLITPFITQDHGVSMEDINEILELHSIFLPFHILHNILQDIEETVNVTSIKEYLNETCESEISYRKKILRLLETLVRSWVLTSNMFYLSSSICFVSAIYLEEWSSYLNIAGSVLFMIAALAMLSAFYDAFVTDLLYIEALHSKVLNMTDIEGSFEAWDSDGDFHLSFAEAYDVIVSWDLLFPLDLFRSLFKGVSKNGDGLISINELAFSVRSIFLGKKPTRTWYLYLARMRILNDNFAVFLFYSFSGFLTLLTTVGSEALSDTAMVDLFFLSTLSSLAGGILIAYAIPYHALTCMDKTEYFSTKLHENIIDQARKYYLSYGDKKPQLLMSSIIL